MSSKSKWSSSLYEDRAKLRSASGTPTFAFTGGVNAVSSAMAAGLMPNDPAVLNAARVGACHPSLDPKGVKFREARDSDTNPEALGIIALLDVTGSMQNNPRIVQAKLPTLMGLLIKKGYVAHPTLMVGAIGDATCDRVPIQVGQFESDIRIEDDLTNLTLEGGGGGQSTESYELMLYFIANHVVTDHWEKRGRKGYIFIIGDENPYPRVSMNEVRELIGDAHGEPVTVEQIIAELHEKWEIFYIIPGGSHHYDDNNVLDRWRALLPERVIKLEDINLICETIASQIGVIEEQTDADAVVEDLVSVGTDRSAAMAVGRAIVPAGTSGPKGKIQKVPSSGAPSGVTEF